MDNWLAVKLTEGVEVLIDPARFEIVGIPLGMTLEADNFKLTLDMNVSAPAGEQESKVENVLTIRRRIG